MKRNLLLSILSISSLSAEYSSYDYNPYLQSNNSQKDYYKSSSTYQDPYNKNPFKYTSSPSISNNRYTYQETDTKKTYSIESSETTRFLEILEETIDFFDFESNIAFFTVMKNQFGESFTYSILEKLETPIKENIASEVLNKNRSFSMTRQTLFIGKNVYIALINALQQSKIDKKNIDLFKKIASSKFQANEWMDIESNASQKNDFSPFQKQSSMQAGNTTANEETANLETLLKSGQKITQSDITMQFILDFVKNFFTTPTINNEFAFLEAQKNKDPQTRIIDIFNDTLKQYHSVLSEQGFNVNQLLKFLQDVLNNHLGEDYPHVIGDIFDVYLEQIKTDKTLYDQVQAGYRVPIDTTFSQLSLIIKEKKKITYETHIIYLLCLQVLAEYEKSLIGSQENLSADTVRTKMKQLLQDISTKFKGHGNIKEVIQSIMDAGLDKISATDHKVLFASTVYKMITEINLTKAQQNKLLLDVKKAMNEQGISLEQVKSYEQAKAQSQKAVKSLTTYNPNKKLMPFSVSQSSSKQSTEQALANTLVSSLSNLFG